MRDALLVMLADPAWLAAFGVAIIVPLLGFIGNILARKKPAPAVPDYLALPEHPLLLSATAKLGGEDRAMLEAVLNRVIALEAIQGVFHKALLEAIARLGNEIQSHGSEF